MWVKLSGGLVQSFYKFFKWIGHPGGKSTVEVFELAYSFCKQDHFRAIKKCSTARKRSSLQQKSQKN